MLEDKNEKSLRKQNKKGEMERGKLKIKVTQNLSNMSFREKKRKIRNRRGKYERKNIKKRFL